MVTKRMWEVEYDLQEPSFGSRAFDTECVEKMFKGYGDSPDHPGRQVYKHHDVDKGEQYEFEPPDEKHGEYVTGADWAKEKDWTVIATFRVDVTPWRLVAYSRTNRKPYPFMVKLFNDRMKRYQGDGIHDGTGLGNVVNDYLDARVTPFIMSGRAARRHAERVRLGGGEQQGRRSEDRERLHRAQVLLPGGPLRAREGVPPSRHRVRLRSSVAQAQPQGPRRAPGTRCRLRRRFAVEGNGRIGGNDGL
jgi:hypothetical protein